MNDHELFKKIEEIPKKVKVARKSYNTSVISLLKTGKFKKVFKTDFEGTEEIDFFDAIKLLEADKSEKSIKADERFYDYLNMNMASFDELLNNPEDVRKPTRNESSILKYIGLALQNKNDLTSYDINFLVKVRNLLKDGHITKNNAKVLNTKLKTSAKDVNSILDILRKNIREEDLKTDTSRCVEECFKETQQIILSEYFIE